MNEFPMADMDFERRMITKADRSVAKVYRTVTIVK